jgi:hypothetical protein
MEMQQTIERLLSGQEHTKEIIEANQAKTDVKLKEMSKEILSIRSELEKTIQHQIENVMMRVKHVTQSLQKEVTERIEKTQVDL